MNFSLVASRLARLHISWPVTRPGKSGSSGVGDCGQPVKVELAQAVCDQHAIASGSGCEVEVAEV